MQHVASNPLKHLKNGSCHDPITTSSFPWTEFSHVSVQPRANAAHANAAHVGCKPQPRPRWPRAASPRRTSAGPGRRPLLHLVLHNILEWNMQRTVLEVISYWKFWHRCRRRGARAWPVLINSRSYGRRRGGGVLSVIRGNLRPMNHAVTSSVEAHARDLLIMEEEGKGWVGIRACKHDTGDTD